MHLYRQGVLLLLVLGLSATVSISAAAGSTESAAQGILSAASFEKLSEGGFGDPQNNYAWSMAEFNGDLYIGTGRNIPYIVGLAMQRSGRLPANMSLSFLTRPPGSPPPLLLAPNQSLPQKSDVIAWSDGMSAEIWRYHTGAWEKVHKASTFINPADGYTYPEGIGYRSMATYNGKLYAGVGEGFGRTLILVSTDGLTWNRINTNSIPNVDTRAMIVHNGKFYVGVSSGLYVSDNPDTSADTWVKVARFPVASLQSYNGYLYAGTGNATGGISSTNGFEVWKSGHVDPAGPDDWTLVIPEGGGDGWNVLAATITPFNGDLYVGSMNLPFATGTNGTKGFDLFRIDPLDRWELVAGNRDPTIPTVPRDDPASGLPSGFGNPFNLYAWSMAEYHDTLYIGTFDIGSLGQYVDSMDYEISPYISNENIAMTAHYLGGADLWKSSDGTRWVPVDLNGFGNPDNYGFRTMISSPEGFYVGTANPIDGCEIWRVPTPVRPLVPVPDSTQVPRDLDGDLLYEDVNGDGSANFRDVIALFDNLAWVSDNEPVAVFDFRKDGVINFLDVVELFNMLPEIPMPAEPTVTPTVTMTPVPTGSVPVTPVPTAYPVTTGDYHVSSVGDLHNMSYSAA